MSSIGLSIDDSPFVHVYLRISAIVSGTTNERRKRPISFIYTGLFTIYYYSPDKFVLRLVLRRSLSRSTALSLISLSLVSAATCLMSFFAFGDRMHLPLKQPPLYLTLSQ